MGEVVTASDLPLEEDPASFATFDVSRAGDQGRRLEDAPRRRNRKERQRPRRKLEEGKELVRGKVKGKEVRRMRLRINVYWDSF